MLAWKVWFMHLNMWKTTQNSVKKRRSFEKHCHGFLDFFSFSCLTVIYCLTVISEQKLHNLTPHFILQFYSSYIFLFWWKVWFMHLNTWKTTSKLCKKKHSFEKQCHGFTLTHDCLKVHFTHFTGIVYLTQRQDKR